MSTKIYEGYRIPTIPIGELHKIMMKLKEKAQKVATEHLLRILDNYKSENPELPHQKMWNSVYERLLAVKKSSFRDPVFDFEFQVMFFPTKDYYFIIPYMEKYHYKELIEECIPGIEFYGYWDNVDPPEGISYKDFKKRGKEWDKVLGKDGIPLYNGFCYTLNDNSHMGTVMFVDSRFIKEN